MQSLINIIFEKSYTNIFKPIAFKFDPEDIHNNITSIGEFAGNNTIIRKSFGLIFGKKYKNLKQNILGINFDGPVGLSAGFDYEAKLINITPMIGFGFHTIGTITNNSYEGNPKPRLGRLPKSKALMVNKGFKNEGAEKISQKIKKIKFTIPVGISVGRTNDPNLSQKESIKDIVNTFKILEKNNLNNKYYELNISCPNLFGNVTFYEPKKLEELLTAVDKLKLKKPIFIKMPITKTDKEILAILKVISNHCPRGVIFGNLQSNRKDPALLNSEVKKFKTGNFSGKPTYKRSNELIALAYKKYKDRFVIIGCGGVFSAADAYEKIIRGASLVQLITGMIFQGPQLISQINLGLSKKIREEGCKNISDAVGKGVDLV